MLNKSAHYKRMRKCNESYIIVAFINTKGVVILLHDFLFNFILRKLSRTIRDFSKAVL